MSDIKIEKILSEEEDKDIDLAPYKITNYGADFTLEILNKKLEEKEIIIPDFQRHYVWNDKKASKLIESFLLGLPVPQIFLYRIEDQNLLVVDGQQRLKSIQYFFEGKHDNGRKFVLKNVKKPWINKNFEDLNASDKRRFKNTVLRATIFEQTDPLDHKSMFEVFERLNTGGMFLVEQEIRNCLIRGPINQFLKDINADKNWRLLLGKKDPDNRMRDIEMILRFFSLFYKWKEYTKPMKDFISKFMEDNKNLKRQFKKGDADFFREIMAFINKEVGEKAFRIKAGINLGLFDSLTVAIAIIGPKKIKKFPLKYENLKKKKKYLELISEFTTDVDRVQARIKMVIDQIS